MSKVAYNVWSGTFFCQHASLKTASDWTSCSLVYFQLYFFNFDFWWWMYNAQETGRCGYVW